MKKNLKKVISAVIALALSVSSVAMAAPKFTDVADTAANADVINTLAALGVIKGYDDGTFKPDNNITRAEVATMVVAALNRTADAEGAKGTTKFADVNTDAKAWASGFVNIGVAEKYISGYEDGTFKPDNNVTYAEMVSMLVRMVGYGNYAEYLGGWPNGYLSVGNDKGITKGVSAAQDTAVTRAQVAQMIYNSIVDVCKVSSSSFTTTTDGKIVPSMTIMDGNQNNTRKASDYQTILTEKFDAYYVEGYVSATAKSAGLNTYKADEVQFTFNYAENYNDEKYLLKNGTVNGNTAATAPTSFTDKVKVGTTAAADYLNTYASAIVKVDDDEATFVSFIPSGKNNTVKFAANLYEENAIDFTATGGAEAPSISFNQTKDASKATKYNLAYTKTAAGKYLPDVDMYVNGKSVPFNKANFETYIVNNTAGEVELVDRYTVGNSADNKYEIINVTYYATAKVGQLNIANKGRVTFSKVFGQNTSTYLNLDEENEDVAFDIYFNGEAIKPSALQIDDILSVEYDVNQNSWNDSDFYTIYVSRDTAEGKYTGENTGDETFTVGGKDYEYVEGFAAGQNAMKLSYEYTVSLDAFGRIFDVQVLTSAAKYALLDRYYNKSSGDDYYSAILYTMDGTTKIGEVDLSVAAVRAGVAAKAGTTYTSATTDAQVQADLLKLVYKDTLPAPVGDGTISADEQKNDNKTPIQDRVVSYKLSSTTGKITSLEFMPAVYTTTVATSNYKASKMTLGSIKMNDATKIFDATEYDEGTKDATYSNLSVTSPSVLVDDNGYDAFCFGEINKSDKTYPLVIITGAGGAYSSSSMFAVLTEKPGDATTEAGDEVKRAKAFYGNEEISLDFDSDTKGYDATGATFNYENLKKGDVIVISKSGNNTVKTFDIIATAASLGINEAAWSGMSNEAQSEAFMTSAFAQTTPYNFTSTTRADEFNNWTGKWVNGGSGALSDAAGEVQYDKEVTRVVFGPVIESSSTGFTLGSIGTASGVTLTPYNSSVKMDSPYSDIFTDTTAATGTLGSTIDIDTDGTKTNVYVYDFSSNMSSKSRLTKDGVVSTGCTDYYTANVGKFYPWNYADSTATPVNTKLAKQTIQNNVSFALVRMVDGEARDVLLITPTNVK